MAVNQLKLRQHNPSERDLARASGTMPQFAAQEAAVAAATAAVAEAEAASVALDEAVARHAAQMPAHSNGKPSKDAVALEVELTEMRCAADAARTLVEHCRARRSGTTQVLTALRTQAFVVLSSERQVLQAREARREYARVELETAQALQVLYIGVNPLKWFGGFTRWT